MQQTDMMQLAVLPGDGIGRDITMAAVPVFSALNIPAKLTFGDVGWEFWKQEGAPIPQRTWQLIKQADATLLGAITSKPPREAKQELSENLDSNKLQYVSPIIELRQKLDLFANVRPCYSITDTANGFDCCIIRENTEGLYAGFDYHPLPDELRSLINKSSFWQQLANDDISCTLRLQSKERLLRLFKFAFNYADDNNMGRVTLADKPNVLRQSSAFVRELFEQAASCYPHIEADILNVDAVALWLVRRPEQFGVIVAENMFGDILSDLGAGVMGGLGFAPSANIGSTGCYYEPVHGSAPRVKPGTANPAAMFLTIGLLLDQFGYAKQSGMIKNAVRQVVQEGIYVTYDLGGNASTADMANAIIERCLAPKISKRISIVATGDEIVASQVEDTNSSYFAKELSDKGACIHEKNQVNDDKKSITSSLSRLLTTSEAVIITGGLGPTSDDNTRYAIARAVKKELYFDETAWEHVTNRLKRFGLAVSDANRQQALFPQGAKLYINNNGTAFGCHVRQGDKHVFMLPGPPKECRPMFEQYVIKTLSENCFFNQQIVHRWLTLGLIEGEISSVIDDLSSGQCETAYRWAYPYLEIKLIFEQEPDDLLLQQVEQQLAPYVVSRNEQTAEMLLQSLLSEVTDPICVCLDGVLATQLSIDYPKLEFINRDLITKKTGQYSLSLKVNITENHIYMSVCGFIQDGSLYHHCLVAPNRGEDSYAYISSYLAWQVVKYYQQTLGVDDVNA